MLRNPYGYLLGTKNVNLRSTLLFQITTFFSKMNRRSCNNFRLTFFIRKGAGDGKHIREDETRLFVVYIGDFENFLVKNIFF